MGNKYVHEHGDDISEQQISPNALASMPRTQVRDDVSGRGKDKNAKPDFASANEVWQLVRMFRNPRGHPNGLLEVMERYGKRKEPLEAVKVDFPILGRILRHP
jgi:hypothetical protein